MAKILTVVIPSYNVEKYLPAVVPTFLDERISEDIEILIVNDGSADKTAEIGKNFQNRYPDTVRVINKENGGHGSTINRGIEEAEGKYFKVVDGDDWVDTEEFVKFVIQLKTEDTDVVLTPYKKVFENTDKEEIMGITGLRPGVQTAFSQAALNLTACYQMHCITIKTEILRRIPKISEHCFYVDQEYVLYPVKYIDTVIYYPFNVYRYRLGTAEQSMNIANMQKNRKMHERVSVNVLKYYLSMTEDDNRKKFFKVRVQWMCERQVRILLSMNISDEVKKELWEYLNKIRKISPTMYRQIPGKKAMILRVLGMKGYRLAAIIQHRNQ